MEDKNAGKTAILLDFENLARAALNDELIPESARHTRIIFSAIGKELLDVAERYGQLKKAVLGFSRPKRRVESGHSSGLNREMIREIHELFDESPYTVSSVPSSHNAVDDELVQKGYSFLDDSEITTLIVGSGDGRDPFERLFRECVRREKKLHIVLYERKPHIFHGNEIPHGMTVCAPYIRYAIENELESAMPPHVAHQETSPAKIYKKILRAVEYPREERCDRKSREYRHATEGLAILKEIAQSSESCRLKCVKEGSVAALLIQEFKKRGMELEMNTALDLTRAFMTAGAITTESYHSINIKAAVFVAAEWDVYQHTDAK